MDRRFFIKFLLNWHKRSQI